MKADTPKIIMFQLIGGLIATIALHSSTPASEVIVIDQPMSPPEWALLERTLLASNELAVELYFDRYFDERGYALCVERWGGDDGPDDASESFGNWPLLYALGASDAVLERFRKGWEGHLRQYTAARTTTVPLALDGMYYKEFSSMFDWLHHTEGLRPFFLHGLAEPHDELLRHRATRFARFYNGTDPYVANYDPKHRIIRSMITGSRGPLLRDATALDWAGDPIEVEGRFSLRHGEQSFDEMLFHFKDYNDVVGDHPQNLAATSLGLTAYSLTGVEEYRDWVLEYVDAWLARVRQNNNIIPTKVGLDGSVGGSAGPWYGGVYGWSFSVEVPQTGEIAHRNTHYLGLIGFGNALLLSGDQRYVDVWRDMIDAINLQSREIDGTTMYPTMYGDDGWYGFRPGRYQQGALDIYYWSMQQSDRARLPEGGWVGYLEGSVPDYPVKALRRDLVRIQRQVQSIRDDSSSPDSRLSDDILFLNPVAVGSLTELMLGGLATGNSRPILHSRFRYFDPDRRRPGLPPNVAALVEHLGEDTATLTLVNISPIIEQTVVVQGGAYGEHQLRTVQVGNLSTVINDDTTTIRLEPGCGARLQFQMDRYQNSPRLSFPWD